MDNDRLLFDWLRYYGAGVALFVLLGLAAGAAVHSVSRGDSEAWSVVVQTDDRIPALQFGFVAQSVFRTASVYGPVMDDLGIVGSPRQFLEEHAELRPVAETDALIVIGRAGRPEDAKLISAAVTSELIAAFEQRGLSTLKRFGDAVPVSENVSGAVSVAIGASSGLWMGLGFWLMHYRLRRPVLRLQRASSLLSPRQVTVVQGPLPRWLGVLRPLWRAERAAENRTAEDPRDYGAERAPNHVRLVASPRTSERIIDDILASTARSGDGIRQLVWIR